MVPMGKQKEGNCGQSNSDLVGLVWAFFFFVGNVLQTPLNTHSGNLLNFISNNASFGASAS